MIRKMRYELHVVHEVLSECWSCVKNVFLSVLINFYWFIFNLILFVTKLLPTESWKYPAHIKHSFLGKYLNHKVPDRKHSGCQQDLKALRSKQCYQMFHADWHVIKQISYLNENELNILYKYWRFKWKTSIKSYILKIRNLCLTI